MTGTAAYKITKNCRCTISVCRLGFFYGAKTLVQTHSTHSATLTWKYKHTILPSLHPPVYFLFSLSSLRQCGLGPPQETEGLLRERPPCAPLTSLDSLGRYSTTTSKTSTSTSSSSATVALNPEFLAKNPDFKSTDFRHTTLPDFIMRTPDTLDLNPDYPTMKSEYLARTPENVIRNLECLALNSECLARTHECPSRNPECPARNPLCPARSLGCPARNFNCHNVNPECGNRYQNGVHREEGTRLLPPHRESSV